jgi:hypothetical protein
MELISIIVMNRPNTGKNEEEQDDNDHPALYYFPSTK